MVHVAHALRALEFDALFEQVLVDVDQAATREDLLELVARELVVAGATTDHHRLDIQVVQRVGDPVEQHPVVGDNLLGLVGHAVAALRIAAAQVARRQHGLNARVPQHGLRGQAHLREQALRTAAGEVEHGLRIGRGGLRIADDRHVVRVFDIQQLARRLLGQPARHLLVHEVHDLLAQRGLAHRGRRRGRLLLHQARQQVMRRALHLVAHAHHRLAGGVDRGRILGVQEEHGAGRAGIE
ncbi:hypothetical protein FQZ97_862640 [compost metagenome]